MSVLFVNATLITLGPNCQVLEDHAILVEPPLIAQMGPRAELEARHRGATVVDLGGRVVMPGQINAHDHLYSALARGIALKDESPQNFLQILERLWWRLDRALLEPDVFFSGMLGFVEAARSGTTTIIDHHASPSYITGSLDVLARASLQVGLRGCYCYEVTDRNGEAGALAGIEENIRFYKRCQSESESMLASAFGLHASVTVGPAILARALAAAPADMTWHVHVAEDGCDVEHSLKEYGKPPLQRLLEEGMAGRKILAAHCIHLQPHEFDLLVANNITVQHNPRSNMNNAVGCAKVGQMLKAGVRVCLGTDGMSQDPSEDFREMALIHKHVAGHPQAFGWGDAYQVGYLNNAALASEFFGVKLGVLEEGAAADLRVVDYDPPTPLTGANMLGHLLFGLGTAPVTATYVGGRAIFQDGKVLGVDEKEVRASCRERANKLWERW